LVLFTLLVVGLASLLQWALHRVQPYYQTALATDKQTLQTASRRLESRLTAIASMAQQSVPWEALFTDSDVNGWLAVAMKEKFPDWLPENVSDLRIALTKKCLLAGFHYQDTRYDTIISLRVVPFMAEANVLAIRLEGARAGALPIPLEQVVRVCRTGALQRHIPVRWTHQENCPLALLPIDHWLSTDTRQRQLETIELGAGQLRITGSSEAVEPKPASRPL